jgi:putative phosphoesterase
MPMTLLIASDSHGRADLLERAVALVDPALLLFLGDGLRDLTALSERVLTRAVCGNCDWTARADAPPIRVEEIAGYRIYMTHGHLQGVKLSLDTAIQNAIVAGADVLLHGHTHIPFEKTYPRGSKIGDTCTEKPLLVLCPGSIGQPPDGRPRFATLTLTENGPLAGFGKL